ncbi:MAG: hypothetical protein AAFU85_32575 [Planctomycetota bacterium]
MQNTKSTSELLVAVGALTLSLVGMSVKWETVEWMRPQASALFLPLFFCAIYSTTRWFGVDLIAVIRQNTWAIWMTAGFALLVILAPLLRRSAVQEPPSEPSKGLALLVIALLVGSFWLIRRQFVNAKPIHWPKRRDSQ